MTTEHVERLRLRYRPDELFDLVADIRQYPKFIPLITAMRVTRNHVSDGEGEMDAEARVKFRFVREKFTSRVHLCKPDRRIDVTYLSGPFTDLANRWRFHELSDGSTLVDFWIRYHFRNPILQMLVDTNRGRAVLFLIDAFEGAAQKRLEPVGKDTLDVEAEMKGLEGLLQKTQSG